MNVSNKRIALYACIILLISIPIFQNLDSIPIRLWDESRNAVNAFEMYQNGNWVVMHYDGTPDMWNSKPPFLMWMQTIALKLAGAGELAIRLPSAIAAFLTCILLLILSVKYLKKDLIGIIAVLILITSFGYMHAHATRTGDFDALLTFFTTISALLFFVFLEKKQAKFLYFFFIALALGVLTKSTAALMFLPALALYALWQKQVFGILKDRHFYFGVGVFLFIVVGYYLLREHYNPGYIKMVQENEYGGRYLRPKNDQNNDIWEYYNRFIDLRFTPWYLLVPCGISVGLFSKDERIKKITVFSSLFCLAHLVVISTAQAKREWYDVPMYPFMAFISAIFLETVFSGLKEIEYFKTNFKYHVIPVLFLFLILIEPYHKMIKKTYYAKEEPWDIELYEPSHFLKHAIATNQDLNNYVMVCDDFRHRLTLFYVKILQSKNVKISYKEQTQLTPGNRIITNEQPVKDYLAANYVCDVIENYNSVQLIELKAKR